MQYPIRTAFSHVRSFTDTALAISSETGTIDSFGQKDRVCFVQQVKDGMPTKIVQRLLTPSVVMEAELSKLYSQGWSLLCAPVPIGEQMALVRDVFLHTKRPPDDELIPKPFLLFLFSKEQTD